MTRTPQTRNRWNDEDAARHPGEVGQRVYTSRLLGQDPALVLHGGGNTSVKLQKEDLLGQQDDVLLVKGSGADLVTIDESGFSPVRLARLLTLAELEQLSDIDMARELRAALTDPDAPSPSVEAILHALLPHRFVDHTHADAVLALTNNVDAEHHVRAVYGQQVVVVPYVMPGFQLARLCARLFPEKATGDTIGMLLMNHGMFSFGATARESYDRMIDLVGLAEDYLAVHGDAGPRPASSAARSGSVRVALADLRRRVSVEAGVPMVVSSHDDDQCTAFIGRPDLATVSQQGPATPDHVIRTKPLPLLGRDVERYAKEYGSYFDEHRHRSERALERLDAAPRIILDHELGMCCVGRTARDARIAEDVYRHTIDVILDATALGGYRSVPAGDLFDVEYWDLEQAKLKRRGPAPPLAGEIVLVTGAASGIGRACAEAFQAEGAAVVGLDVDPTITSSFDGDGWLGMQTDVTDEAGLDRALEATVRRFGGLDILVLNAGVFPSGREIAELSMATWRSVMDVNLDANLALLREAHPLLRLAPRGGRVVVIGSKNVPAPGPGAAAYSASKAALTQLARVAALEWAADAIRVNIIHPNAVFDTAIWTEDVLAGRAARYGMSVEEYRRNTLLGVEVESADVARLCTAMCGPAFAKTTGAQVPVDGGNERVI